MSSGQKEGKEQVALADIGYRIRQERERLRLSVTAFASAVGVTDRSQRNYESGLRVPDAGYLLQAYKLGVDTEFILTGEESDKRRLDQISKSVPAEKELLEEVLRVVDLALQQAGDNFPATGKNACIVSLYVTGRYGGPVNLAVANEFVSLVSR